MVSKFGPWNWRDGYRYPVAGVLGVLVARNYYLRARGRAPDTWYWADRVMWAWGYTLSEWAWRTYVH